MSNYVFATIIGINKQAVNVERPDDQRGRVTLEWAIDTQASEDESGTPKPRRFWIEEKLLPRAKGFLGSNCLIRAGDDPKEAIVIRKPEKLQKTAESILAAFEADPSPKNRKMVLDILSEKKRVFDALPPEIEK